eukprot:gene19477-3235_t
MAHAAQPPVGVREGECAAEVVHTAVRVSCGDSVAQLFAKDATGLVAKKWPLCPTEYEFAPTQHHLCADREWCCVHEKECEGHTGFKIKDAGIVATCTSHGGEQERRQKQARQPQRAMYGSAGTAHLQLYKLGGYPRWVSGTPLETIHVAGHLLFQAVAEWGQRTWGYNELDNGDSKEGEERVVWEAGGRGTFCLFCQGGCGTARWCMRTRCNGGDEFAVILGGRPMLENYFDPVCVLAHDLFCHIRKHVVRSTEPHSHGRLVARCRECKQFIHELVAQLGDKVSETCRLEAEVAARSQVASELRNEELVAALAERVAEVSRLKRDLSLLQAGDGERGSKDGGSDISAEIRHIDDEVTKLETEVAAEQEAAAAKGDQAANALEAQAQAWEAAAGGRLQQMNTFHDHA